MTIVTMTPDKREFEPPLDPKIAEYVEILRGCGVETYESCQGGEGHAYLEPTVRLDGDLGSGFYALSIAQMYRMPIVQLRHVWRILDHAPRGPNRELVFRL